MSTTTAKRGSVRIETGAKRVRAYLGGEVVADTTAPLLVWERPYYPTYYFPVADVRAELLPADDAVVRSPSRGDGRRFSVRTGGRVGQGAAVAPRALAVRGAPRLVRLEWDAMDEWFEEDEEVFTHPRDPYTRVDILASSPARRRSRSTASRSPSRTGPRLLFETGLPTRYYLPKVDVRMELLEPTDTVSHCPYKGKARYWSVRIGDGVHDDLAWSYPTPLPESQKIAGLVCFYNEKVDIYVDGVLHERPRTKFS